MSDIWHGPIRDQWDPLEISRRRLIHRGGKWNVLVESVEIAGQVVQRDIVERGRTLESVLKQYKDTVRPMYLQFIEPSRLHADLIVPRGGENRIAIDMIQAKMRELLRTT